MSSWRWRTGLAYLIFGVVLFGVSAFFFGSQGNEPDELPTGTEVISQGLGETDQGVASIANGNGSHDEAPNISWEAVPKVLELEQGPGEKAVPDTPRKSDLELIGIKSEGTAAKRAEAKSVKDFQSPVQGVPLRKAGNYYSESLQAYLFHAGTDYAQSEGAVIRVKHPGKVIYAGPDPILGQKVEIDCGEDWSVIYGGLENLRVKEGDQVEVNQAIGQVGYFPGAEGVKDQPQLHFEVWHGDEVQIP